MCEVCVVLCCVSGVVCAFKTPSVSRHNTTSHGDRDTERDSERRQRKREKRRQKKMKRENEREDKTRQDEKEERR